MNPTVSFVVPCYKLAHYLPECLDSILAQTYKDFEVVIMDDCSPDSTREVVQSYADRRIGYIRNPANLGHLRNYNTGITVSRGKYIWLISADDRLRRPYVLERYVEFLEAHPNVGCVFCSGVGLLGSSETGVIGSFRWSERDRVYSGLEFLKRTLRGDVGILAPSAMARRDCYEKISMFPIDMPHMGDAYMWSVWAIHYDMAYMADPMVNYRLHAESMMSVIKRDSPETIIRDQVSVQWRVKAKAEQAGLSAISRLCRKRIIALYSYALVSRRFRTSEYCLRFAEVEADLRKQLSELSERRKVRARVCAGFADGSYRNGNPATALKLYRIALWADIWMPVVWAKYILLRMGTAGCALRRTAVLLRTLVGGVRSKWRYLRTSQEEGK